MVKVLITGGLRALPKPILSGSQHIACNPNLSSHAGDIEVPWPYRHARPEHTVLKKAHLH